MVLRCRRVSKYDMSRPAATHGEFKITLTNFNDGAGPIAHLDSLTEMGAAGSYSAAQNVDIISLPGKLQQGPGLASLTNGTQAGAVGELIVHILDTPVSSGITYGIAASKLHQISATAVTNTGSWPHAITSATAGSSVIAFQGYLFYFFNKSAAGECGRYDLSATFVDNYISTVPTGAIALQKADHPVATRAIRNGPIGLAGIAHSACFGRSTGHRGLTG